MTGQITISIWIFLLLIAIAILAILDRVLIPSTRWFLRRRVNRVIDEISKRLDIEIKPFQLTKRQVLIDRLIYDPNVVKAVQINAQEQNMPREFVQAKVMKYAKEIVPSFNAYLYFRIGYWLAKKIANLLYHVHIGLIDNEQFAGISPDSTVVFVMNHRSNMDYILVAFLAAEKTTLSWAKVWPLQALIRSMGAFFVRRKSGNPLYRRVLERYIHMATKEGVCQAVFLEGGLTRDGLLRPPKLGFVDYMLRSFKPGTDRDIIFIPVGINYDRTLEDRSLLRMLNPDAQKRSRWFIMKTTIRFVWRSIIFILLSRWQRFGYASVNFGQRISAREYCRLNDIDFSKMKRKERFGEVGKISEHIMASVQNVIPVLPVPLVAAVFVKFPDDLLSAFDVEAHANRIIDEMRVKNAPVFLSTTSRVQTIVTALNMLRIRRLVIETDGLYKAEPEMLNILSYYANSIDHYFPH